jgi:hypothetical protein
LISRAAHSGPSPQTDRPLRTHRLSQALPFVCAWYAVGFALAVWDPRPGHIVTVAVGTCTGMLVLGPYAAAAIYGLRLQRIGGGHLRWPMCLLLAASTVLLLDYAMGWSSTQLLLAMVTAVAGTVLGHDATLAVLDLRHGGQLDALMVVFFPVLLALAVAAGYSSFGFAAGTLQFATAMLG